MAIAFAVIFIVFFFLPILLWWIRNVSRIFFKRDINWISDNMFKIFLISFALALFFVLLWGLTLANII